jgi:hypothetical protein
MVKSITLKNKMIPNDIIHVPKINNVACILKKSMASFKTSVFIIIMKTLKSMVYCVTSHIQNVFVY